MEDTNRSVAEEDEKNKLKNTGTTENIFVMSEETEHQKLSPLEIEVPTKADEKDKKRKKFFKCNLTIKILKNLAVIDIIIISFLFYLLSLEGCEGTQIECLLKLETKKYYLLGAYMGVCTLIMNIVILLMIKKIIHYLHLTYIIPLYIYLLFIVDNGSDLTHHGAYNRLAFFTFMFIVAIIIQIFIGIYKLIVKKHFIILALIILSILLIVRFFFYKVKKNCRVKWSKGLGNITIEYDSEKDLCIMDSPKRCWMDMGYGFMDISWYLRDKCTNRRLGERAELIKNIDSRYQNTYNFGIPVTTNYTWVNQSFFSIFPKKVLDELIDLDVTDLSTIYSKPEIFLSFDKKTLNGNIDIKITRNETLANIRNEIYNKIPKNKKPKYSNFIFLYIDAISRPHFMRAMKHTNKFLLKFIKGKYTSHTVYQMMKYQSLNYFTSPNVNPMFFGQSMYNKNGTNVIRAFKEKGFITAQSNNICGRLLYDIQDSYSKRLDFESCDHENIALFCDPNYYHYGDPFGYWLGPYSIKRKCLYGKDTFEYVFDYGKEFWEAYKNERKFLRLAFQDAHEGTTEVVKYLDKKMGEFLNEFYLKGYLEDTVVYIVSDHGNHMMSLYRIFNAEDQFIEKTLPVWIMLVSNTDTEKDKEMLRFNQQTLVTPYDIHETMLDILRFPEGNNKYKSKYGKSVYNKINTLKRDCNTFSYDLKDKWCRCHNPNTEEKQNGI